MYYSQTPPRARPSVQSPHIQDNNDVSQITTKKEQYRIDIIQNEIDIIKFDIQNQLLRQNELRLKTLTKEISKDLYQDQSSQANKELLQARNLIKQLQSENQTLVVSIRELQYQNEQHRKSKSSNLEETDEDMNEVNFLKSEIHRLQDIIQMNEQNVEQNQDKDVAHWKDNCQRLLEAFELISTKKIGASGLDTPQKLQEDENSTQQSQIQQQYLNQIQLLQGQIQDRDQQISAFKQIFASNPKVTIKFPPCLRITTVMGQPVIVPLSQNPINSVRQSQTNLRDQSPLKQQQPINASPRIGRNLTPVNTRYKEIDQPQIQQEKNIFIHDCQVAEQKA